jgi:hypothetical protein
MSSNSDLEELQEELEYWNTYEPVNNMGKWYKSIRITKIEKKITELKKNKLNQ